MGRGCLWARRARVARRDAPPLSRPVLSSIDPRPGPDAEPTETDVDPAAAERELVLGQARRKRRLLELEKEASLGDTRYYAVGELLDRQVEAVLDGQGITTSGGSAGIVGEF